MKKIKILLTFDYELPLGFSRDYEAGLFRPAQRLLERAGEIGVPVVLFADVCSAIRFESWDRKGFYDRFVEQVQLYLQRGNDVQLHIHPHWMTSSFSNGSNRSLREPITRLSSDVPRKTKRIVVSLSVQEDTTWSLRRPGSSGSYPNLA